MKSVDDLIRAMEEIEEEDLPPIDFAKKSAAVFNTWADENPGELEALINDRLDWCSAYYKRVGNRMKDVNWNDIWPAESTTRDDQKEEELP